jgi:phage terminase large subunit GpA-like protein
MREISEILGPGMHEGNLLSRVNSDFKFFYENVLGFNEKGGLNQYKQEWFNLAYDNDYVMIKAPSGFAKTTVLGVAFPIWWILTHPKEKILLVSKTLSQAKDALLLQIRDLIDDNVFLKKALKPEDKDAIWNQTQIKTLNSCSVINRPYSINIKSYRANVIILDEIDSYEDTDIYFDHVLSRLIPGGKIIGISTPEEGTSTLMELIKLRESGNRDCIFKTYTAIVDYKEGDWSTGKSIWPEEFPD